MSDKIYREMWSEFSEALSENSIEIDPLIHSDNDQRRGVTALAYLDTNDSRVADEICGFLTLAKEIEPLQYFYPRNELHLTVLSIITTTDGFKLSDIDAQQYKQAFLECLEGIEPIEIEFKGITASPSCVVIQGFPVDEGLTLLRDKLRSAFQPPSFHSTFDVRYKLVTAHSTVIRFASPIRNSDQFLQLCESYKNHHFGNITLSNFELVFNDWYQRLSETKSLASYSTGD